MLRLRPRGFDYWVGRGSKSGIVLVGIFLELSFKKPPSLVFALTFVFTWLNAATSARLAPPTLFSSALRVSMIW